MTPLVAKIGGSLWGSPRLGRWIAAITAWPGPLTIVPGGGPFADAVRTAQVPMRFSDRAAHEMALLAMEQYGLALCDLFPGLALADTPQEASALQAKGLTPVWRPRAKALEAGLPESWDVTSDSLAAWYAQQCGAQELLLIKSVDPDDARDEQDLVDPCFAGFAGALRGFLLGPKDLDAAEAHLPRGMLAWRRPNLPGLAGQEPLDAARSSLGLGET
jgi:5-(aminomethyl)-3-furanmethanol phosphate kinase